MHTAELCCIPLCCAAYSCAVLHTAVLCCAAYRCAVLCCIPLCCAVLHTAVLCYIQLCCAVLYTAVMCCDAYSCDVLHTAVLCCARHSPVTACFGSARPGIVIPFPKNIYFVGSRNTLSVATKLLLLRLYFVFYYNFLLLQIELFQRSCRVQRVAR